MNEIYSLIFPVLSFLTFFLVYVYLTLALNLQQGYCGIPNLGLYMSVLVGALVTAVLPGRLAMLIYPVAPGMDFVDNNIGVLALLNPLLARNPLTSMAILSLTIFAAVGAGLVTGYLTSFFVTRLRGDYLAVLLLVLAESLRQIGQFYAPLAGGVFGISIPNLWGWLGDYYYIGVFATLLGTATLVFILVQKLSNSPFGRLLKSIRENELTAQSVGKNIVKAKAKVMAISSGILALAGAMDSLRLTSVVAATYNRIDFTFWPWLMVIVGGSANNWGVIGGAFIMIVARNLIMYSKPFLSFLPFNPVWIEPVFLGVLLLLVMLKRPEGLVPEKRTEGQKVQQNSSVELNTH